MPMEFRLNVLLKKEGPYWVAQCLQYDVAGHGKTKEDACYQVERAVMGHAFYDMENGIGPLSNLPRAPREYWKMYDAAIPVMPRSPQMFESGTSKPIVISEVRV